MKIFNIENNKEVVYVQKGDLAFIMHYAIEVPGAFVTDFFNDIVIINDSNRMEFVRFEHKTEIDYLKEQDWIIDYRDYINLTEEKIKENGNELVYKINETFYEYNDSIADEERKKILEKYQLLRYKLESIKEIVWLKQGRIHCDIPLVPDFNGFSFGNEIYTMNSSLDPNKILVFRKDEKVLDNMDGSLREFIKMGTTIAIDNKIDDNMFDNDYVIDECFSNEKKYLIIEFKKKRIIKDDNKIKNEENGVKKFIKSIFKRGK